MKTISKQPSSRPSEWSQWWVKKSSGLKSLLFATLLLSWVSAFTSCHDDNDDINVDQKEITIIDEETQQEVTAYQDQFNRLQAMFDAQNKITPFNQDYAESIQNSFAVIQNLIDLKAAGVKFVNKSDYFPRPHSTEKISIDEAIEYHIEQVTRELEWQDPYFY